MTGRMHALSPGRLASPPRLSDEGIDEAVEASLRRHVGVWERPMYDVIDLANTEGNWEINAARWPEPNVFCNLDNEV